MLKIWRRWDWCFNSVNELSFLRMTSWKKILEEMRRLSSPKGNRTSQKKSIPPADYNFSFPGECTPSKIYSYSSFFLSLPEKNHWLFVMEDREMKGSVHHVPASQLLCAFLCACLDPWIKEPFVGSLSVGLQKVAWRPTVIHFALVWERALASLPSRAAFLLSSVSTPWSMVAHLCGAPELSRVQSSYPSQNLLGRISVFNLFQF